jgi:peptidyl-prolyl cis-trans isomerase D
MLQNIRDKAQGWIAWAIVILISIPFALWGIQEYMGVGSEPLVASVNGEEITERQLDQRYRRFQEELRAQLGDAYRPELFDEKRMRQEVLERMVSENVVLQATHEMGLRVGNPLVRQAIMEIEAFQKDGRFDQATFDRYARMQGLSSGGFEERIRQALLAEQLTQAVQASAFITDREIQETLRLQNQTRDLAYFVVSTAELKTDDPIPETEIEAYYTKNSAQFRTPEQVKLDYILLNGEMAGNTLEVDEDALREYYDNHLESYGRPEERQASHILITLDEDADQASVAAAEQKIAELRDRAVEGEDFATLAKAHSEDPGSADAGGNLGFFPKGIMDPAFETAAFSLQEGELSEPVRSSFGIHLIKLTGIKPSSVKPFEEVRDQVEQAYRKVEGERVYFEMAEQLADLTYEDPGSLVPAASSLNLEVTSSDWISRDRASGVLQSPKVLAAAFREDVLIERNNSELIELDKDQSIVIRVTEHRESSIKPLSEVQEAIVASLHQEKAIELARQAAEKRLASLNEDMDIEQVSDQYSLIRKESLTRSDPAVPRALLSQIFRLPHPEPGQPLSGMTQLANGDFAVYRLYAVKDGATDVMSDTMVERVKASLRRRYAQNLYESLVADLVQHADISYLKKFDEVE